MSESRSYSIFLEAVLDLSDEATPVNVRRYLAASRLLDRPVRTEAAAQSSSPVRRAPARELGSN
jgi:hypothetical protein